MIGPTLFQLQKLLPVPAFPTVLAVSLLWYSTVFAESDEMDGAMSIKFDCAVQTSEGEVLKILASLDGEDQVSFKINGISVVGLLVPTANIHTPTIGFVASTFDGSIYTLTIHRALVRPEPDGFDPTVPPAALTVQWTDQDISPVVDVFLGNCVVHE